MKERTFSATDLLNQAYANIVVALHYASLLARHGEHSQPHLIDEPVPSLLFPFQSNNENVPRLAKEQFGQELVRYALIYSIAQYDRFVLELAVLDAVMSAAAHSNGKIATGDVAAIDQRVRGDSPNSSVAAELRKLAGADNPELSAGLGWFAASTTSGIALCIEQASCRRRMRTYSQESHGDA